MNKKTMKILTTLLIIMIAISMVTVVMAAEFDPSTINGSGSKVDTASISGIGNDIVVILRAIGVVTSVVILIVLGLKYMIGSAEEKAEYKKTLIPYAIGAGLIFAASVFANALYQFFISMGN